MFPLIQVIIGLPLVLFIPGYTLSYAFFPKKDDIDSLERIILSFGLSITTISLAIFFLNKFLKVPITVYSSLIVTLALTFMELIIWKKRK